MAEDMVVDHCGQSTPLFKPGGIMASMVDDRLHGNKKRGCEEFEDTANPCGSPNLSVGEKKVSKPLVLSNKFYFVTNSETGVVGPDRHSANLAALLAPIR